MHAAQTGGGSSSKKSSHNYRAVRAQKLTRPCPPFHYRSQQLADKRAHHAAERLEVRSAVAAEAGGHLTTRSICVSSHHHHNHNLSPTLSLLCLVTLLCLQLEQQMQQLDEQRQHVAAQLEQLDGCEGGDMLGVSDLKQQLQVHKHPSVMMCLAPYECYICFYSARCVHA